MSRDLSVKIMECYHNHEGLTWSSLLKTHRNNEVRGQHDLPMSHTRSKPVSAEGQGNVRQFFT